MGKAPTSEEILVAALVIHKYAHKDCDAAKQLAEKAYEADKAMTPPYGAVPLPGTIQTLPNSEG